VVLVDSNAISKELSILYRQSHNLPGGVIYLFYFAAFILEEKQSVLSVFGESPNTDVKVSPLACLCNQTLKKSQPDGRFYIKNGGALLYNDLLKDRAALWESRLIAQSHAVQVFKTQSIVL
jgi:hypothetical protein